LSSSGTFALGPLRSRDHRSRRAGARASGDGLPETRRDVPPNPRRAGAIPTILVAGVVRDLAGLRDAGRLARARWRSLEASASRRGADLVVVGGSSRGVDAVGAIARLKEGPGTEAIPVLHAAAPDASCPGCRADVCLPAGARAGQMARVAGVLLDLHHTRSRERVVRAGSGVVTTSERLESLGRLTGGIVHDFNNLLFVITGQIDLARRALGPDHPAGARLGPALQAVERAAALTRQLLAFSRGSSPEPRLLDLNTVVAQLDRMLRRVIGSGVEIEVRAGRGLGPVRADRTQMEQLVLNLALNARDAMPGGGRLTIETRDVVVDGGDAFAPAAPGRHVLLAVSDEGVGIDAETRRHIFEPFFTTKPEGAGSGIGLATVHGIVEQAGGSIRVDSEPGEGTTFRVYLPCAEEPLAEATPAPDPAGVRGGRETVLVAEDSEAAREVTREMLAAVGYTVLAASRGEEALAIARSHRGPIDLLLADVAMPGLHGRSLAEQVRLARPGTRVLFMSGGGEQPSPADEPGLPGPLLPKPFGQDRLARAVREALDRDEKEELGA
jgi:signal transduction histidine kinase/ActR/RegA family two-component response regulator